MTTAQSDTRLSVALGEETRSLHRSAERTRTMGALLRGSLSRDAYVLLLRNLHAVYVRLEDALTAATRDDDAPVLGWLDAAELDRAPAMADDLDHLHGPGWADQVPVLPATDAYRAVLDDLQAGWPLGLAAHAWVRYMGDLSGGQILGRLVARHYDVEPPDGVRTYLFAGDVDEHKAAFRRHLDEIPPEAHPRMVEEARRGFALSIEMLDEVTDRD